MTDADADADVEAGDESANGAATEPAADDGGDPSDGSADGGAATTPDGAETAEPSPDDAAATDDAEGDAVSAWDRLVAEVASHDEALAGEVADLGDELADAEAALDERAAAAEDLESKLKRERADFQNYKRRVKEREAQVRERATADLVERLLDVRDNLVRALEQDADADIRDGVEATLASFDRVLADEAVAAIEPDPGEAVDPERHEVVLREPDGSQSPGTIERIYRPGYELAGTVLRPAQVTVSESGDDDP